VETLNVNKSVNQSEKAVRAGSWHRNRAVSIGLQNLAPEKNIMPDACQMVWHTLQILASIYGTWNRF